MSPVLGAWLWLVAASAATTGLAAVEARGLWVAAALLALALAKARIILADYLRLAEIPPVRRGFMAVLLLWAGIALALAAAAQS